MDNSLQGFFSAATKGGEATYHQSISWPFNATIEQYIKVQKGQVSYLHIAPFEM